MAASGKSVWRAVVAIVATCLLVMQTISGSLVFAAEIAPTRDALGGIICISHADGGGSPQEKEGHELPSCCLLGCNVFGAGMVAAAAGSLIDNWLGPRDEPIGVASDAGPFARPETHPRSPRAPPYLG